MMIAGANSKDGGATWAMNNPAIQNEYAFAPAPDQLVVSTTQFGYGRWDAATDIVNSLDPPFAIAGVFARRGTATIFSALPGTKNVARQTKAGAWSMVTLPDPPSAPSGNPNIYGFAGTETAVWLKSDFQAMLADIDIDAEGRLHFFYNGSEYRTKESIEPVGASL
jgi:hypothetical protein